MPPGPAGSRCRANKEQLSDATPLPCLALLTCYSPMRRLGVMAVWGTSACRHWQGRGRWRVSASASDGAARHTHTHTHAHAHTRTHTHTLSLTHSHTRTRTRTHTHTRTHTRTHTHTGGDGGGGGRTSACRRRHRRCGRRRHVPASASDGEVPARRPSAESTSRPPVVHRVGSTSGQLGA